MSAPFLEVKVAKSLSASETMLINLSNVQRISAKGEDNTIIFFALDNWIVIKEHYNDVRATLKEFNSLR